jgi:hypothetical protein
MMMTSSEFVEMGPFVEKASRIELIIRWVYGIIFSILYGLWSSLISIIQFIHFFYILIMGRRSATLYRYTRRFLTASTYFSAYLMFLTDQRPDLIPDLVFFYKRTNNFTPPIPQSVATAAGYCKSCGASLLGGTVYCPNCGQKTH